MALVVYLLCGFTGLACTAMTGRAWLKSRVRLLLWCSLCFLFLAINNVFLFFDLVIFPQEDYTVFRSTSNFIGLFILVFGLIWDSN
jgi:hypothetical protein